MKKSTQKRSFIKVVLAVCVLSSLLFFTTLDNKFFDLFLRFLPSLTENNKVYVLTLDDDSMYYAGGFPFKREIMGDVIILLKELGVETIAFDLSYLDESAARYDVDYASEALDGFLNSSFYYLNEKMGTAVDSLNPASGADGRSNLKRDIRRLNQTAIDELEQSVPFLGRDVDEYFAKAIAFTGNTWLTLTMISQADMLENSEYQTNKEVDKYLSDFIAPGNITGINDTKTHEMVGVMPAIQKLLSRAKGAGFVNASPDRDGTRRRVDLLLKYKDEYYGQLTLMAMQEKLGFTSIDVTNKHITLKKNNDVVQRIPRARDGSVLFKWPKKNFYNYYMMSLLELIQYTAIEASFVRNMTEMYNWGLLDYFYDDDEQLGPWDYYSTSLDIKNEAFANNDAAAQDWLDARSEFFRTGKKFLSGHYYDSILSDVGGDEEFTEYVKTLFAACRKQFDRMTEIRNKAAVLKDSFCVIGSDATSMTDNGMITFQETYPNVGSYAVLANMLLSGEFVKDSHWLIPLLIAIAFSLAMGYLISRFETFKSILTGISGLLLLSAFFILFFMITKTYIGFAVPLVSTTLTFVTIMVTKFLTASREKAFLHNAFSRYLAPEVITDIINNPDKLNLGGEKREMTAIFTDIQGFSTISEKLDPTQLVKLLNRYLTAMSNIIMENLGTIDKYEGDAIIAFFGAPVFRADHPVLAVKSAIAMKTAELELNKSVLEEKLSPMPIFTRIGINTGEMVVGNMGAENKMDYTIMGNAVNLAARLEGVNKQYHTGGILMSEYTKDKIMGTVAGSDKSEFLIRPLDRVRVVGINTPVRLYEVLCLVVSSSDAQRTAVEKWEKYLDLYEKMEFAQALAGFNSLIQLDPNDKVSVLYAERCQNYIKEPPPSDWDAVKNLTEK